MNLSFRSILKVCVTSTLLLVFMMRKRFSLTKISSEQRLQADLHTSAIIKLPAKLRKSYQDDGFVVLPKVVPQDAAEELRSLLEKQQDLQQKEMNIFRSKLSSVSKTTFLTSAYFQPIADVLFTSRIAEALRSLLQAQRLYHFFDALYIKFPKENGGFWHRDYPVARNAQNWDDMVSAWMPLVHLKGDINGGSMVLARGSHKWSLEEGCTGLDHIGGEIVHEDWEGYEECMGRLDAASVVLPSLAPGDLVVFHPGLFHRTSSSQDLDVPRMALSLVAITEKAKFRVDQSDFRCSVKALAIFALEEEASDRLDQAEGHSLYLADFDGIFPELVPENVMKGPGVIRSYYENPVVQSRCLRYILTTSLLSCGMQRWRGEIPHTYAASRSTQA